MFHLGDSLYIIIKNIYGDPNLTEGTTYIYRIPDSPEAPGGGTHTAVKCTTPLLLSYPVMSMQVILELPEQTFLLIIMYWPF